MENKIQMETYERNKSHPADQSRNICGCRLSFLEMIEQRQINVHDIVVAYILTILYFITKKVCEDVKGCPRQTKTRGVEFKLFSFSFLLFI